MFVLFLPCLLVSLPPELHVSNLKPPASLTCWVSIAVLFVASLPHSSFLSPISPLPQPFETDGHHPWAWFCWSFLFVKGEEVPHILTNPHTYTAPSILFFFPPPLKQVLKAFTTPVKTPGSCSGSLIQNWLKPCICSCEMWECNKSWDCDIVSRYD